MGTVYLLGLDIGTSGCKGVLVDIHGNIKASLTTRHSISQPQPGWAEHDPEKNWWDEMVTIIKHCLTTSGINPKDIAGISAGGLVPNLCPLDEEGNSVRPAILYRDNRAVVEAQELSEEFNLTLGAADVTPKLYWLKKYEPENYKKIKVVLNAHSYIAYKLTGNFNADCDIANIFGGVFDLEKQDWNYDLFKRMGLNPEVLPPIFRPTDVVGTVSKEAAAATGLAPGIPVVAGNGDSFMSLLGAGVVDPGDAMLYFGTAGTMLVCEDSLVKSASSQVIRKGSVEFLANILTGGELTRWFREQLQIGENVPDYPTLECLASEIAPGSEGLIILPHLMGERTPDNNPLAKGVVMGLTTAHTGAHIYRALMESFGYALLHSLEQTDAVIKRVVATGGGAKSSLWRQIVTDITGLPLEYISKSDAALGNAYFAGYSLGLFSDFAPMKNEWLKVDEVTKVNPESHKIYSRYFNLYKEINSMLKPAFVSLADIYSSTCGGGK
ncbi:MAG: FGGY-family carbohydrate kinase [Zhaonellaceae bacterium]